ncbi:MAG: NUDIX hydrolase [Beijerinckiaceae bacterium]
MAGKKRRSVSGGAAAAAPRRQYAALPYRRHEQLEVMLVSSRETRRWVLPKGWPMKGKKPHTVAATEALEEAGLLGKISKKPIGAYHYVKRMPNGAALDCEVEVFPFRVEKQRKNWRERDQRTTSWFAIADAAHLVDEPQLSALLLHFAQPAPAAEAEQAEVTLETIGR